MDPKGLIWIPFTRMPFVFFLFVFLLVNDPCTVFGEVEKEQFSLFDLPLEQLMEVEITTTGSLTD